MGTYAIHNTVRGRHNRAQRAAQPQHHRFKHYIAGQRLIRGRPLTITEEQFQAGLADIKAKAAVGILEVRTPDGRLLDLETMQPVAPAPPSPPLPNPPDDSIANDKPWGETIPRYPGEEPPPEGREEPKLVSDLESTEEDEEAPSEHSSVGTNPTEPAPSRGGKKKGKR